MPVHKRAVRIFQCLTRYLASCSPFENGSYLLPTIEGGWDEYTLYCRCKAAASRWKSSEFLNCEVSGAAFERGYGTADEITVIRSPQQEWSVDVSQYLRIGSRPRSGEHSLAVKTVFEPPSRQQLFTFLSSFFSRGDCTGLIRRFRKAEGFGSAKANTLGPWPLCLK